MRDNQKPLRALRTVDDVVDLGGLHNFVNVGTKKRKMETCLSLQRVAISPTAQTELNIQMSVCPWLAGVKSVVEEELCILVVHIKYNTDIHYSNIQPAPDPMKLDPHLYIEWRQNPLLFHIFLPICILMQ
jgi:hypothetical protein